MLLKQRSARRFLEEGGAVIVASSGMLTGGPSLAYFYQMAENPKNCMIFVGYQGEGALGRKLQGGIKMLPVPAGNGRVKALNINMRIETVEGFSGHSDRMQLMNYVRTLKPRPKRILVNHGNKDNSIDFSRSVAMKFRINTTAPRNLDSVRLR